MRDAAQHGLHVADCGVGPEQPVGPLAFGCWRFVGSDVRRARELVEVALDEGLDLVDTADIYGLGFGGAGFGAAEELLGRVLAEAPELRDRMVLATKGGIVPGVPYDSSVEHLVTACEASLRRLGVDSVDLYQVHAWDPHTPLAETLRTLDGFVRAGKIGYYGFSNFLGWQLTKAVHVAKAHGWSAPVTLQPQYNLVVRDIEHEVVPAALDAGIGLLPWSPLAGGWLTGKYERDVSPTGPTRLGDNPARGMEAWEARNADDRTWRVVDAVREVSESCGASASQVALAWLAAQPAVTSVILGARNVEQLADNLAAADLDLPAEQLDRLSDVSAPRMDDYPYGTAGVGQRHRDLDPSSTD